MHLKLRDLADIMMKNIILALGIVFLSLFSIILGLYSKPKILFIYIIITVFIILIDIIYRYRWLNENNKRLERDEQNQRDDVINAPFTTIIRNFLRVMLKLIVAILSLTSFVALPLYGTFFFIGANSTVNNNVFLIISILILIGLIVALMEYFLHDFKEDMSKFFQWKNVIDKKSLFLIDQSNFLILYSFVLLSLAFLLSFSPSTHNLLSSGSTNSSATFQTLVGIFEKFPKVIEVLILSVPFLMYTLLILVMLPLKYGYEYIQKHKLANFIKKILKINSNKLSNIVDILVVFIASILLYLVIVIIQLVDRAFLLSFYLFLLPNSHLLSSFLTYPAEILVVLIINSYFLIPEEFFLFVISLGIDSLQVANGKTQDKNGIKSKIQNFIAKLSKLSFVDILSFLLFFITIPLILITISMMYFSMLFWMSLAGIAFSKLYHPLIGNDLLVNLSVILIWLFTIISLIIVIKLWLNKLNKNSFATFTFLLAQITYVVSYGIFIYMFLIVLNTK